MTKNSNMLLGIVLVVIGFLGVMFSPSVHQPMNYMIPAMTYAQFPPGLAASKLPEYGSMQVSLLTKYCTQCHALPGPGMHTEDDWPQVVGRMSQYMQTMHTFHVSRPSLDELQSIQSYLQKHAQVAMEKSKYPELDSSIGIAFLQTCSRCHSTPDPKQHTAEEWTQVVERMKHNMKVMRKAVPDDKQFAMVLEFLKKYAQK